ncbi:hypothetical protein CSIM01_05530 [Colletotrichum simmondsii]|uniref:Fungal N-terminal domain-containing protein n=1 Tax=Colletotrichum simmondsii TaxID=703756 RepID=A0A135S1G5_9PEZI|nr:hypothetical protein CSIM01_05530 [Colletotrichum simmondsii]
MAAESVGLAASVAGLLSLGLQITGGIVKYMDAFEGRDEELRNVRKQNDNLGVTLHAMKTVLASLQGQSPAVAAAVDQNIRSCEEDLRALEALCIELSDHAGSTWTTRLENKKKKVTFAFHRPKLRDLELQLQKAHGALQLIQSILGLETSNRNTALLSAIESSSRDQASEMLLIRSEVAALTTPVAAINDKLPGLQSVMTQTGQLVGAHSGAIESEIHESSQRVRYDIQHSHNSILEHLKTIDHKVQLLGEENSSLRALALKVASKPAVLKSLCDDMQLSGKYGNQGNASNRSKRHRKIISSDSSLNFETAEQVGKRGYTYFSGEWESQGHWSSCPLSRMPRNQRLKAGVKYTGVSRLLKSVIEISFVFTSGAGGCSISPSFTYYLTVDVNSDPAFRLINLMRRSSFYYYGSSRELFYIACLRKLAKLLEERQTYPTVVDDQNMTLMHYAAASVRSLPAMSKRTSKISKFTDFSIAVHRSLMSFGKLLEVVTAFECGPLSMAIVNNDSDEVDRILKRFPDSIAELDLYGRSPLHLAAAKPEILKRLVKAADLITLNQRDSTGTNALETAMVLSSLYCVNGTEYQTSCCNTHSMVEEDTAWIGMDDVEIVENQGFLLELHEKLVAEFTQKAGAYLGDEPNMGTLFPQFWTSYWADRMTQELEVLHGEELTESERRDAEEIGVVWHQAIESDKSEDGNPYRNEDLEHYFFELDLICPEYNEPWPEELRRIR